MSVYYMHIMQKQKAQYLLIVILQHLSINVYYITLYYITLLHYTTLHYTILHYTKLNCLGIGHSLETRSHSVVQTRLHHDTPD